MLRMDGLSTPAYLRVRQKMLHDIASGAWPVGAHMTLAALEDRYGVSQSPVREALLHLAGDGVLAMRAHRGATLPAAEPRRLRELYAVRGALQALTAREAAERATASGLAPLYNAEAAFAEAASAGDAQAAVTTNRAFHAAIDALSGNALAAAMLETRAALVDAVRRHCGYGTQRPDIAIGQHRGIVAAIARNDGDAAARLAHAHGMASWRDLEARLPPQETAPEEDPHDPKHQPPRRVRTRSQPAA